MLGVEQIVRPCSDIEQVARRHTGRIMIVIFGAFLRNDQPGGSVVGGSALGVRERSVDGGARAAAKETDGGLLRAGQPERVVQAAHCPGDQVRCRIAR